MANAMPGGLEPAPLWSAFDVLRSVPRGSGAEAAVRDRVIAWAKARGLDYSVDAVGNLVVRVPATAGKEACGATIIQGHLDMVCEKNADIEFDFATEGINVEMDGEFLTAIGTTLGADNGIGVATGMALADDPTAVHGPLELLMTIDEERGLTGAAGLQPGFVSGRRMLNLDTEEEGAIYVGCAGGGDVRVVLPFETAANPESFRMYRIEVKGLAGGHSGLNIVENRANAITCLARALSAVDAAGIIYRTIKIEGGSMRNAIPREAGCGGGVSIGDIEALRAVIERVQDELRAEFAHSDPDLRVEVLDRSGCTPAALMTLESTRRITAALLATPSNVVAMSQDVPGLVETSNNLGVVRTVEGSVELVNCTRSSKSSALEAVRASLAALYRLAGGETTLEPSYPGWQPDLDSALLAAASAVHREVFGVDPEIKAVHAGLECGLIGEVYPGLDMISIGPDITGAHSPDERVSVPSTARFYTFVKAILAALD